MGLPKGAMLRRSSIEKHMGHKLAIYSMPSGVSWSSVDGVITGPWDSVEEAEAALDRAKAIARLEFYTHRTPSHRTR
tara:strand:+ start:784 stop:1014 length:231 start_codon:yes stop_codon:yes gene_type:complete